MRLEEYFSKLKSDDISIKEYDSLKRQCLRLVKKACRRYKINDILLNTSLKQDVYRDIYIKSLLKSLKNYNKKKGAFSTFFYYKALSSARCEVGKLKRRLHINNTYSLDETFYNRGKE